MTVKKERWGSKSRQKSKISTPIVCCFGNIMYICTKQIDLLIDRRDHAINVCEAKFSDGEFVIDKDYSLRLRNKIAAFKAATKTRKSLVPTMITTFGVKRNQYSGKVQQEVVLDDLFVGK